VAELVLVRRMARLPRKSVLTVLVVSGVLFAVHFALLPRSGAFGLWTSMTLFVLLGYMQRAGLPVLTSSLSDIDPNIADPSKMPVATTLGTCIIIVIWWASYFLITLGVATFIRYVRRDASRFA
jgi:hypothetical protein